ncbi:unnamed protein product, partial [marine sediment metagenome]
KPWDSEFHVSDVCVDGREDFEEESINNEKQTPNRYEASRRPS